MRYAVTGAAGHLGSTILRELSGRHREVFGLLYPGKKAVVEEEGFHYFYGDLRDPASLEAFFAAIDEPEDCALIHTAGLISIQDQVTEEIYDVNVRGVSRILDLCRRYRIGRLVYVCSVHAIEERSEGQVITEPESLSPDLVRGGYARTKAEAAALVRRAAAGGLDAVIVYPSGLLGPFDEGGNHLIQLVRSCLEGSLLAGVRGGYDFVDVRDAARGCLLAAQSGAAGEDYILSGHYLTVGELLGFVADYSGKRRLPILPIWMARLALPLIQLYSRVRRSRPLYTAYSLEVLSGNGNFSSRKAQRALGYRVRPVGRTLRDMVDWIRGEPLADGAAGKR